MTSNVVQQMILIIIGLAVICRFNIRKYKKNQKKTLENINKNIKNINNKEKDNTEIIINYISESQKIKEINTYIYIIIIIVVMAIFFQNK